MDATRTAGMQTVRGAAVAAATARATAPEPAREAARHGARDPEALQRLSQAVQVLDQVEGRAERLPDWAVGNVQVARCYAALDMPDTAEWYYRQAAALARRARAAGPLVDSLAGLAEALSLRATAHGTDDSDRYAWLERARDLCFEALSVAARALPESAHPGLLMHLARVLQRCGDERDADALRSRAGAVASVDGLPA